MGMRGGLLRAGALSGFAALATVASCRDPTEVTLVLTTDVPCKMLNETSITVGRATEVESKQPVTVTSFCNPNATGDGTIGTFVVIPNSTGASDAFAVRIVSAVYKKTTQDCVPGDKYTGCIIARRELAFVPHTPLTLPIAMRLDCLDVPCMPGESCVLGECRNDHVDPPKCATGCPEQSLSHLDGGSPEAEPATDAPPEATGSDAPLSDGSPDSTTLVDAPETLDAPLTDATGSDGPDGTPGPDASGPDASSVDARADAPVDTGGLDATGLDASPDTTSSDAAPFDGTAPGDGGPLGTCVGNGTSSGVSCGGGTCQAGQVCCAAYPASGGLAIETCTSAASCNVNLTGTGFTYSSLACRNIGDCPSATVCCYIGGTILGSGDTATCTAAASCTTTFTQKVACRNKCECSGTLNCGATTCLGTSIATCGGICP